MAVIVVVIEEDLSVGNAVFGGDGRVVDLRNANVEETVAAADDERAIVTEGIGKSDARADVVRIVKGTLPEMGKRGLDWSPAVVKVCKSQRAPRLTAKWLVRRMVS